VIEVKGGMNFVSWHEYWKRALPSFLAIIESSDFSGGVGGVVFLLLRNLPCRWAWTTMLFEAQWSSGPMLTSLSLNYYASARVHGCNTAVTESFTPVLFQTA
jgi:hypothetical protein